MTRHQALALVVVLVVVPSMIYTWGSALNRKEDRTELDVPVALDRVNRKLESVIDQLDKHNEQHNQPAAEPEPLPPPVHVIERVEVNGQDVADLLGISLMKFRFLLPDGRYTAHLWTEQWTRNATAPTHRLLMSGSGRWGEGDVTVKLPLESDTKLFLRLGDSMGENDPAAQPLDIHTPIGWATLDSAPLAADRPVHLLTLTHNDAGPAQARLADAHTRNDQTIYLKIVFTPGENSTFDPARWVPGITGK